MSAASTENLMSDQTAIHQHQEPISVSSDVLARLGEELITNHIQALAELVKNAYDADATIVKVKIDTTKIVQDPDGNSRQGLITVADNGFGMDEDQIRNGWLRVSASPKRAMKLAGEKTPKKRTPLGDKGLGRLGAQRLGDRVRIRTRPQVTLSDAKSPAYVEHDVAFAFSSFRSETDVNEIRVPWITYNLPEQAALTEEWPVRKATGAVIEISGLSNAADWSDLQELERALSLLVNPFKNLEKFSVSVKVDGLPLNLQSVANEVRDAALSRWEGSFDGATLAIDGTVRLSWFNVRDREDRALLQRLIEGDGGTGLRDFILGLARDQPFKVTAGKRPWLLKIHREITLVDLDTAQLELEPGDENVTDAVPPVVASDDGPAPEDDQDLARVSDGDEPGQPPVDPGEFLFELDVVSRRLSTAKATGVGFSTLDRQSDYRDWLDERGGMHVYRDGFRINLGDDFMRLGEAFSSSSSYYGLRPANVIGYVEITAEHNGGLEETTDREGFRETPEVKTFRLLVDTIRDEINKILDVLGRSAAAYIRRESTDDDETTEELAAELAEAAAEAKRASTVVAAARSQVSTAVDSPSDEEVRQRALESAAAALAQAAAALERTTAAERLSAVVRRDVAELSERVDEYAQLIGLGLVAETLAHELNHVSGRLSGQITDLQSRASDLEPWARAYLQETRSALDALHGQLRHLDPMLRYARTKRERIELETFAREMSEFHAPRLREKRIEISVSSAEPGVVTANRGRLMQVFDNLVINAEYWLEQALRAGRIAEGQIMVEVLGTSLSMRDNGPGVDKSLERTIFDPFVTAKSERGRGLGLFICRQLLDLDGGTIQLGEQRNRSGRATTFEIHFDE
jgi:signal transduction histidine kinase